MATFLVTDPASGRKLKLTSQDDTPPSEQELEQVFSGQAQSSTQVEPQNKYLSETPIPEQQSAISIPDRAWLSFHNDKDKEKILKRDFSVVQKQPDGNFLVGNDTRDLQPVSPDGLFNDLMGKIADHASDIPVIVGQLAALGLAPEVAIPARMAISGLGAGAGQAVSSVIGEKKIGEIATDVAATTAFGAMAEGLVQGAATGAKVLAPKLSNMLHKINLKSASDSGVLPEQTPFANTTTKVFKYLANVPESSTQTFFKYGMKEMNNPVWFKPETVKSLVTETVDSLETTSRKLGEDVARQTDSLINIARSKGVNSRIPTQDLFLTLKKHATDLGILDDFGKVNSRYPNSADIKPITNLLDELGLYKDGKYISDPNKTIPVKKALQISKAFGQKFESMNPKVQAAFYDVLNGNESAGLTGLRPSISNMANKLGVEGYSAASKRYAGFSKLLDDLKSLDASAPSKIETFINRLEKVGQIDKDNLIALDKITNKGLLKKWELWNAAQDFNKTDLNVLRFGAIAAAIGGVTGFQSNQSKAGTLIGAGLLGTPAGLRLMIRMVNKSGMAVSKEKLREIGMMTGSKIDKRAASALLTQIIKNKSKSFKQDNNSDNNNKKQRQF